MTIFESRLLKYFSCKRFQWRTKLKFYGIKGERYNLYFVKEWLVKSASACFNCLTVIVHSIWIILNENLIIFDALEFKIGYTKTFQSIQLNKRWCISSNHVRRTWSISRRITRENMHKFILVHSPEEIWSVRSNRRRVQESKIDILHKLFLVSLFHATPLRSKWLVLWRQKYFRINIDRKKELKIPSNIYISKNFTTYNKFSFQWLNANLGELRIMEFPNGTWLLLSCIQAISS